MTTFEVSGDGQRIPRVRIIKLGEGVEIRAVSGPGYAREVELAVTDAVTGGATADGEATAHDHDADYEAAGAVAAHADTPHGGDAGPHVHAEYLTDDDLALHSDSPHGLSSHAIDGAFHSGAEVLPTAGQKNALRGTSGTPGDLNRYVTDQDVRLSDDRAPTAHDHAAPDLSAYATLLDLETHEATPHGGESELAPHTHDTTHSHTAADVGAASTGHTHDLSAYATDSELADAIAAHVQAQTHGAGATHSHTQQPAIANVNRSGNASTQTANLQNKLDEVIAAMRGYGIIPS